MLTKLFIGGQFVPARSGRTYDVLNPADGSVLAKVSEGGAEDINIAVDAAAKAAGGGSIINVASFVALVGCTVPQDAYTASKGAVLALSKSLAVQYGPKGIRTNAICPGPIETPLLTAWLFKEPAEKAKRLNRIPAGRFGKSEDIVNAALYLASDESRWTNGLAMVVDGGITSNYF